VLALNKSSDGTGILGSEKYTQLTFSCIQVVRIFGPKRDEVRGEWRKLHNEELNVLYCSSIKSRRMRWVWHVARMGEGRGVYMVLVGKPEGKRPLGRSRRIIIIIIGIQPLG
jgi:hypothetical protein